MPAYSPLKLKHGNDDSQQLTKYLPPSPQWFEQKRMLRAKNLIINICAK